MDQSNALFSSHSIRLYPEKKFMEVSGTPETITRANCTYADIPAFQPGQRHFRLTEAGHLSSCQHFVAVSYCWQRAPKKQLTPDGATEYFVETREGIRTGKAPIDVIDRAVSFAASHDLGLIWIDQEVIDQDDPWDKSQAIQVMDIVYERSLWPVAILDTTIVSQNQLDILDIILRVDTKVGERVDEEVDEEADNKSASNVIDLLELLTSDLYYTRLERGPCKSHFLP